MTNFHTFSKNREIVVCTNEKKSDFHMGHVEIWFLVISAIGDFTNFLKMYGNFSMTITYTNSYRNTYLGTGKSMSEALIFASINPQYDNRLFIELQVQYMKIPSSNLVVYKNCFWHSEQFSYITCSPNVFSMFWAWNFHVLNC